MKDVPPNFMSISDREVLTDLLAGVREYLATDYGDPDHEGPRCDDPACQDGVCILARSAARARQHLSDATRECVSDEPEKEVR